MHRVGLVTHELQTIPVLDTGRRLFGLVRAVSGTRVPEDDDARIPRRRPDELIVLELVALLRCS